MAKNGNGIATKADFDAAGFEAITLGENEYVQLEPGQILYVLIEGQFRRADISIYGIQSLAVKNVPGSAS